MFTARQIKSIVRRYKARESSLQIAQVFGTSHTTILNTLRSEGVRIRRRGRYRQPA